MTLWGEGPVRREPDRPESAWRGAPPEPATAVPPPRAAEPATTEPAQPRVPRDPVAVTAVGVGLLGIVVLGIVAAVVAGILGAAAGQRARDAGRSLELPYLAFVLAALDGVLWIVLHYAFKLPIEVG